MKNSESLEIVRWHEIKHDIMAVNPVLAKQMSGIPDVDHFKLVRARYPFGATINKGGKFHLYYNDQTLPHDSELIPETIKKLLNYSWRGVPFGIVLRNSMEAYINHSTHIVPFRLLTPGATFSLLTIFEEQEPSPFITSLWSNSAGCRSLVVLPSIQHQRSNKQLQMNFELEPYTPPKNLSEHWDLLKKLSRSEKFQQDWYAELIIFSQEFIRPTQDNLSLRHTLLNSVWQVTGFARHYNCHEFVWNTFLQQLPLSIRNNIIVTATAAHLIMIALRQSPGYTPAVNDLSGPISGLMEAFINVYGIRTGLPIIMNIDYYNGETPIYYSLNKPSFLQHLPHANYQHYSTQDIIHVKKILVAFKNYILKSQFAHDVGGTLLHQVLNDTQFDFYHPKKNNELGTNLETLAAEDERFRSIIGKWNNNKNLAFPKHSPFFQGCVRITPKYSQSV